MCVRGNTNARTSNLTNFHNYNKNCRSRGINEKTAAELNVLFRDNKMDTQHAVSAQITWQYGLQDVAIQGQMY